MKMINVDKEGQFYFKNVNENTRYSKLVLGFFEINYGRNIIFLEEKTIKEVKEIIKEKKLKYVKLHIVGMFGDMFEYNLEEDKFVERRD